MKRKQNQASQPIRNFAPMGGFYMPPPENTQFRPQMMGQPGLIGPGMSNPMMGNMKPIGGGFNPQNVMNFPKQTIPTTKNWYLCILRSYDLF